MVVGVLVLSVFQTPSPPYTLPTINRFRPTAPISVVFTLCPGNRSNLLPITYHHTPKQRKRRRNRRSPGIWSFIDFTQRASERANGRCTGQPFLRPSQGFPFVPSEVCMGEKCSDSRATSRHPAVATDCYYDEPCIILSHVETMETHQRILHT